MTLRVAVVGSGPAGFYAAGHLLDADIPVEVDMIERLPTPWGLVRLGVAPDHPKIKAVSKAFERIAAQPGFRFLGGVEVGRDLTQADLLELYDAVVYAVGAQTDRHMGIPGENLPGSWPATEFVAWYNGHPDYQELEFHGVKVVVDPFSEPYLQGSTIDFLEGLQESGFKIENPNVSSACGCGHSFQVEDGEAPDPAATACGSGCGHSH